MKKIALMMVALLTVMTAVAQQDDKNERKAPKKPTPAEVTNRMAEKLNLTDKQKSKVLELNKAYEDLVCRSHMGRPHMGKPHMDDRHVGPRPDGFRTDANPGATEQQPREKKERQQMADGEKKERPQLTEAQKKEMMQNLAKRREYDIQMKRILTDEQYQEYQKMQPRHGGFGGPRHHGKMNHQE